MPETMESPLKIANPPLSHQVRRRSNLSHNLRPTTHFPTPRTLHLLHRLLSPDPLLRNPYPLRLHSRTHVQTQQ